jgi:hypothetical protein
MIIFNKILVATLVFIFISACFIVTTPTAKAAYYSQNSSSTVSHYDYGQKFGKTSRIKIVRYQNFWSILGF